MTNPHLSLRGKAEAISILINWIKYQIYFIIVKKLRIEDNILDNKEKLIRVIYAIEGIKCTTLKL